MKFKRTSGETIDNFEVSEAGDTLKLESIYENASKDTANHFFEGLNLKKFIPMFMKPRRKSFTMLKNFTLMISDHGEETETELNMNIKRKKKKKTEAIEGMNLNILILNKDHNDIIKCKSS